MVEDPGNKVEIRDFKIPRHERQRERQKNNYIGFARASHLFVHFFSSFSTTTMWTENACTFPGITLAPSNHLISNKREWNNCFIKKGKKYPEFLPTLFVKTTNFQLVLVLSRRVQLPYLENLL